MLRLIRLLGYYFRANILATITYRASFVAGVASSLMWVSLALVSIAVLTYQSPIVGGWNRQELFLVQGVYSVILGFMYFLFVANFKELTQRIRRGDLDFILVKPYDSQVLVSIGKFSLYHVSRIIGGIIIIVLSLQSLNVYPTFPTITKFLLLLIVSVIIVYSIWFMISTLAIWFVDLFNLEELLIHLTGLTRYPLEMFRYISDFLLYVLMPLVVVTTVPSQVLLQKLNGSFVFWSIIIAFAFFIGCRKFWHFALRYYTSASS